MHSLAYASGYQKTPFPQIVIDAATAMYRPLAAFLSFLLLPILNTSGNDDLVKDVRQAMLKATRYFHGEVATQGGYVYEYSAEPKVTTRRRYGV
jgi:hypothetical protein